MRGMWAAGAAMLLCLALGGGVPVGAQTSVSETPEDAVVVTATQECAPTVDMTGGAPTFSCTLTASDPRVTGPLTMKSLFDISTPNSAGAGITAYEVTLEGPGGTWTGRLYLAWDVPGGGPTDAMMVLTGTGADEGWTYVSAGDIPSSTPFDHDSVGTLYPGSPPPPWEMPAATEPSPSPAM